MIRYKWMHTMRYQIYIRMTKIFHMFRDEYIQSMTFEYKQEFDSLTHRLVFFTLKNDKNLFHF